ncbi:MAG: hypothetical protein WDO13_17825 [Verrucomicrobiota bacterium]
MLEQESADALRPFRQQRLEVIMQAKLHLEIGEGGEAEEGQQRQAHAPADESYAY